MRTDRISLDPRAFGLAAGAMAAALFTICALIVAVVPGAAVGFFGYILHLDLTGLARPVTVGNFVGGLFAWTIGVGIVFGLGGVFYNRLVPGRPAVTRVDATQRVA